MGVITKEIELPDPAALRKPAGMPSFKRDPISEITAFDRYAGDHTRTILVAAGAGVALLVVYTMMSARPPPDKLAPSAGSIEISKLAPDAPAPAAKLEAATELAPAPATQLAPATGLAPAPAAEHAPAVALDAELELPARGMLHVRSDPEATVYQGSTRLGRTPLDVELTVGTHELRLVNTKLHLETRRKVEVRADKPRTLELLLGVSKLRIKAPKGTKVHLDKRFIGETPLKAIELVEGVHRLEVVYGDQRLSEALEVPPGTTIRYRPHFEE